MTAPEDQVDYLTLEDLLEIGDEVVDSMQVRDLGLLASAAARPQASAFGLDAYLSFAEKAAALMHSLARNHALVDGNRQLAWAATRVFCLMNSTDITFTVDAAEELVLRVAEGNIEVTDLARTLSQHLQ